MAGERSRAALYAAFWYVFGTLVLNGECRGKNAVLSLGWLNAFARFRPPATDLSCFSD